MLRPLIKIDEEKCNGCGQCILDCAEGALKIVNGKAKLVSESYCDGLGACLNCPQDALSLEMQEAPPFDEAAALAAKNKEAKKFLSPLMPKSLLAEKNLKAELPSWPIQLELLPAKAGFLKNADILLAAHCSGFALPDLNEKWLKGRIPIIACPKLENNEKLIDRFANAIKDKNIKSITLLRMSVPCCGGLEKVVNEALRRSGEKIPVHIHTINL